MESKDIRDLIELISRSNFSVFELERDGFKIKLVKEPSGRELPTGSGEIVRFPAIAPAEPAGASRGPQPVAVNDEAAAPADDLYELNSPIVGTFFSASSPEAPNFVEVGAQVKKGQVLCIVEAMKVMNEIESAIDAEVAEVLVASGQPVEFGEVLFRLRPA